MYSKYNFTYPVLITNKEEKLVLLYKKWEGFVVSDPTFTHKIGEIVSFDLAGIYGYRKFRDEIILSNPNYEHKTIVSSIKRHTIEGWNMALADASMVLQRATDLEQARIEIIKMMRW